VGPSSSWAAVWAWGHEHKQKPAISPKWCKIGPKSLWRANRKSHTPFQLYQNQWPWMTLNGQNALLRKNRFTEPTRQVWMNIDTCYDRETARCRCKIRYLSTWIHAMVSDMELVVAVLLQLYYVVFCLTLTTTVDSTEGTHNMLLHLAAIVLLK